MVVGKFHLPEQTYRRGSNWEIKDVKVFQAGMKHFEIISDNIILFFNFYGFCTI